MNSELPRPTDLYADQGFKVIIIAVSGCGLAALAVPLRFLSRRISRANLKWDDWMILTAAVGLDSVLMCLARFLTYVTLDSSSRYRTWSYRS